MLFLKGSIPLHDLTVLCQTTRLTCFYQQRPTTQRSVYHRGVLYPTLNTALCWETPGKLATARPKPAATSDSDSLPVAADLRCRVVSLREPGMAAADLSWLCYATVAARAAARSAFRHAYSLAALYCGGDMSRLPFNLLTVLESSALNPQRKFSVTASPMTACHICSVHRKRLPRSSRRMCVNCASI